MTRREFGSNLVAGGGVLLAGCVTGRREGDGLQIAIFTSDITPPPGHALMGGGIEPVREIETPLTARGIVLLSSQEKAIVFVALDWCELRNGAYLEWQGRLAAAAGTSRDRVMVTCTHVHDAPVMDTAAERLLREAGAGGSVCDLEFNERALAGTAAALEGAIGKAKPLTGVGMGQGKVHEVASNRRFFRSNGEISFSRTSSTNDPEARAAPEGTIDPMLKMVSFWSGDAVVATVSCYATHPMSSYGRGVVSWDFVGDARERMNEVAPGALHIYASGCSGNVTAGKYNDGGAKRRGELAGKLFRAMREAWEGSSRRPARSPVVRSSEFILDPRTDAGFGRAELEERLRKDPKPFGRCLAALGLSWLNRVEAGLPLSIQAVDFGGLILMLLPAESYVEYQLHAQEIHPDGLVLCCGYGECGPGYIPTELAWKEGDTNLRDWCWVAPGGEERMRNAVARVAGVEK